MEMNNMVEDKDKETLAVVVPPKMREEIEEVVRTKRYMNVSDFVRTAIRELLNKEKVASEGGT